MERTVKSCNRVSEEAVKFVMKVCRKRLDETSVGNRYSDLALGREID